MEVGRQIRVLAHGDDDAKEITATKVDDDYPLKDKQISNANDQRMCVTVDLVGDEDEGDKNRKCLVEFNWNCEEKLLRIFPDFNELNDNPHFIEFDSHPSGQMLLFSIEAVQQTKKKKLVIMPERIYRNHIPLNLLNPSASSDRNHFLLLLLFTFETAQGFDYDQLHFQYTINHAPSRTDNYHSATHTIGSGESNNILTITHSFEKEFLIPYENEHEPIEMLVEAYSLDSSPCIERYHGWSWLTIPPRAGQFNQELQFIREVGTWQEDLERFFIGGHRRTDPKAFKLVSLN